MAVILETQHRRKIAAGFWAPEIFHLVQLTWQTAVTFVVSHCQKINAKRLEKPFKVMDLEENGK